MNKILTYILTMAVAVSCGIRTNAQTPLPADSVPEVLSLISSDYKDWMTVEASGKLKTSMLPVTPSIKLFMKKGEAIRMSVRVALMGEVGRLEIDSDSILLVNKMKKVYCQESMDNLKSAYPDVITDIQNFLLGRIVIMGKGELSAEKGDCVELYHSPEGGYIVVPEDSLQPQGISYGYVTYPDGKTAALMLAAGDDMNLYAEYAYGINLDMDIQVIYREKEFGFNLAFDNYKWDVGGFPPFKIEDKYKRVSIQQFIQSSQSL